MKINPKPERPPATDPNSARYWDERDLEGELHRVFEICHSCRMCVNFCGSFPDLFNRVDRDIETRGAEGAEKLDAADFASVVDLCWQCKMCYIECPYTPDQGHAWMVDFPRLAMREKAHRAKRNGVSLQDRALGEPGKLGALASGPMAPLANFVNKQQLLRKVNEKVLGISAEFPVPMFAEKNFPDLAEEAQATTGSRKSRLGRALCDVHGRLQLPAHRRSHRRDPREERIFGRAARAGMLRHSESRRRRYRRRKSEGALQRRAPLAARRSGNAHRRAGPDLLVHDQEGMAGIARHAGGEEGRRRDDGHHGVHGEAPPRQDAREGVHGVARQGRVSRRLPPPRAEDRYAGRPAFSVSCKTPRSRSSRSAPPSTARGE